jgi:hypothetical protein
MEATAGDRISVDSAKAGQPPRQGKILEVIRSEYGTSYRVAWDDGHESTFRPVAGTVHTVHPAGGSEPGKKRVAEPAGRSGRG